MDIFEDRKAGIVIVSLRRGELLLESLSAVARQADVSNGVVMSGIGSLTRGRIHTVISNDNPPGNEFIDLEGPLEVVQFGGIIANYQPHVHISLWDRAKRFHGGHLEDGCEILALSEISIQRLPELKLTRRAKEAGGPMLLDRLAAEK